MPTPDNYVHVLGMALQDEFPPLPKVRKKFKWKICSQTNLILQSIQDAVDSAEEGVILFSLGFSFIPDRLPKAQVTTNEFVFPYYDNVASRSWQGSWENCLCLCLWPLPPHKSLPGQDAQT